MTLKEMKQKVLVLIEEYDPDSVIQNISDNKRPEHDPFHISDMSQKQRGNKDE